MNHLPNLSIGRKELVVKSAGTMAQLYPAAFSVFYGNYCGPGRGSGKGCDPAIDEVDAVCCKHDTCFENYGYDHCACNCDAVKNMPAAIAAVRAKGNNEAVTKGRRIMRLLAVAPCLCYPGGLPIPGGAGCGSICS